MKAWIINKTTDLQTDTAPLTLEERPKPQPKAGQILLRVLTCGICHTELDEIEGRTPPNSYPRIPGHQVVGEVEALGHDCRQLHIGDRVGVAWIFSACGSCAYCKAGMENLCSVFRATGRDADGGYAEYIVVPEDFAVPIPALFDEAEAAPLLCAGAIGYRSLHLTHLENGQSLGLMGFGASAHLVLKMARHRYPDSRVYVFARNTQERQFAKQEGAFWCGDIDEEAPERVQAIIDTTPAWKPVMASLANLLPGGRLVINAIRKEEGDKHHMLYLDYDQHLWMEKEIKSVANVTMTDVREFVQLAAEIPIHPVYEEYMFHDANRALLDLKHKRVRGAKVLRVAMPTMD